MKNIFLSIFILVSYNIKVNAENTMANVFSTEITSFINITQPISVSKGAYNIYIVNVIPTLDSINHICFSLSYIRNSYDIDYVHVTHYFKVYNGEYVLLNIPDENSLQILASLNLMPFDKKNPPEFMGKLFPEKNGGIAGIVEGEICCINESNELSRKFYENSDEMPSNFSIYDLSLLQDIKIEKIKIPFNK